MLDNAAIVRQFVDEVMNGGDIDGAGRFLWEDVVQQEPFPGQGPGLPGFQEMLREARVAFPDIYWSVEEQLAEGDRVLSRFVWTGTHRAPFLGVQATGRHVSVWGMVIDRLVAGRIKETRFLMDTLGLMMQLGRSRLDREYVGSVLKTNRLPPVCPEARWRPYILGRRASKAAMPAWI